MVHDRIHAQRPAHDRQAYSVGRILACEERDGHAIVTVQPHDSEASAAATEQSAAATEQSAAAPEQSAAANEQSAATEAGASTDADSDPSQSQDAGSSPVELRLTTAVRDLFVSRLELADDESPVGCRVWYRTHGSRS